MSEDSDKKGFAGIATLVSEIDDVEAELIEQNSKTKTPAGEPNDDESRPRNRAEKISKARIEHQSRSRQNFKWIFGLIVMVGLVAFIFYSSLFQGDLSNNNLRNVQSSSSSNDVSQPTSPVTQNMPDYFKPSVGRGNLLSISEIRWCLRQGIRIDLLRTMVKSNSQIDNFNILVNEYNSRCGSYRYRPGTLERAQQQIEQQRAQIAAKVSLPWLKIYTQAL